MKTKLKKRLDYLWTFELLNAVLIFPGLLYTLSRVFRLEWFTLAAQVVVSSILIVGASFWFLKRRALDGVDTLRQPSTREFYRATKLVFGGAMAVMFVLFAVRLFGEPPAPTSDLVVGFLLTLMALLEYVNYYFIQLSYDNRADLSYLFRHRRLKRAAMVRELDI